MFITPKQLFNFALLIWPQSNVRGESVILVSVPPSLSQTTLARHRTASAPVREPRDQFVASQPDLEVNGKQLREMIFQSVEEETVRTFPGRDGYDKDFLGVSLALPELDASVRDKAAPLVDNPDEVELKYTNFSIVMNKERRQAMLTVVNIDGSQSRDVPRSGGWAIDGRIAREHQLGNEGYTRNPIDRGHLVRRSDPVWGPHARRASEDTFVFTNAGLQHGDLNQKEWLELENHVLSHARAADQKMTVFTGPVLKEDDPQFDNDGRLDEPVQIPEEFWKVVVWKDDAGELRSAAFVLSQEDLIDNKNSLFQSDFDSGRFAVYQVPLEELEGKIKMDFGPLRDTVEERKKIGGLEDVSLHNKS